MNSDDLKPETLVEPAARRQAGARVLLTGNEAAARGALEAGVRFAASYPGSPTVEILATLARLADEFGLHAEWSVNEIVALEAAAGASYSGLRALASMKPDGFNVAYDFATSLALAGVKAGLVIVVGDDPGAHSGVKEQDCRRLAKAAEIPLLEPSSVAEAKEMTKAAFELSEGLKLPVLVRLTTRICHSSGDVSLGSLPEVEPQAEFGPKERFFTYAPFHPLLKKKLAQAKALNESSPFNSYQGPPTAERLVIASGVSALYAAEALDMLGLGERVGLLKIGASFPLPAALILERLKSAREVVFCEEFDPFLEEAVLALAALHASDLGQLRFHGQLTGEVGGPKGPGVGELGPDVVTQCLGRIFGREPSPAGLNDPAPALALLGGEMPEREHTFCAGCPHRASFWALRQALRGHQPGAVVLGDIGCYTLALGPTGYYQLQTVHCMGGGLGIASGMGQLGRFGLARSVVAVLGDGTFYHAGVPALINARHQNADLLCIILDNLTTAMTGHQPHPGRPQDSQGRAAPQVEMGALIAGLGIPCEVSDPYDLDGTAQTITRMLAQSGPRVLILRRDCALVALRGANRGLYQVDKEECSACGLCHRDLACPACHWDEAAETAAIDPALCVGCGVCAGLCPSGAIQPAGREASR